MRITELERHALVALDCDPTHTSSTQDSFVVVVRTDEGITGIGESDVSL